MPDRLHLKGFKNSIEGGHEPLFSDYVWIPLDWVAWLGHKAIVDNILAAGRDLNMRHYRGQTPLSSAMFREQEGIIETLLQDGRVDPNPRKRCFNTSEECDMERKCANHAIVARAGRVDADSKVDEHMMPLQLEIQRHDLEATKLLLTLDDIDPFIRQLICPLCYLRP